LTSANFLEGLQNVDNDTLLSSSRTSLPSTPPTSPANHKHKENVDSKPTTQPEPLQEEEKV
jgi:hypothetical protein